MLDKNTTILNQLAEDRSDLVGFSRFLSNDKITTDSLVKSAIHRCSQLVDGRDVLVINDTTDFNFRGHQNILDAADKDIGPMCNEGDIGFYLHPALVVDAEQGLSLGFSYIKIWNRPYNHKKKLERNYKSQPLEKKESYRWVECGLESKKNLSKASHLTIIADRESDIYQEFALLPDLKTDLIIRSCQDRRLDDSEAKLYETLSQAPLRGEYNLKVRAAQNGKRQGRETLIEVRFKKVRIRKPITEKDKSLPSYVELYGIEAKEKNNQVPSTEKPICWRLLTTYDINNFNDALLIIQKYALRWQIELLFGTVKSKGLNLEDSQIKSGSGLKNLCLLTIQVALKINQLTQGRDNENGSAEISFTPKQLLVLRLLINQYEGKTEKQKNHFKAGTLAWAAWVIARMGGWKGYDSEAKPGNKTMRIGLVRFENVYTGWKLTQKMCA
jgi:hypothetical protein